MSKEQAAREPRRLEHRQWTRRYARASLCSHAGTVAAPAPRIAEMRVAANTASRRPVRTHSAANRTKRGRCE